MSNMFTPTSPSSTIPNGKVFSPTTANKENHIDELFHLDNQRIQSQLNASVNNLSMDWKGSILFHCHVIYDPSELTNDILSTPPPLIDICNFLGGEKYPAIRLHFSSSDYLPPKTNEDRSSDLAIKCSGWADLCRDLMSAAHHAGNGIICNGSQRSVLGAGMIVTNKVFWCGTFY
jgi:hypothetical protein